MLSKIFAPKREDVTEEWKGLHGEVYKGFSWENLMERDHLEDMCLDGVTGIRIFKVWDGEGHGLDSSGSG